MYLSVYHHTQHTGNSNLEEEEEEKEEEEKQEEEEELNRGEESTCRYTLTNKIHQ